MQMQYNCQDQSNAENERAIEHFQTSRWQWEKPYVSCRTPFWKQYCEEWLFPTTSLYERVWVAKTLSRCFKTLLQHIMVLKTDGYSSRMFSLLKDILFLWGIHHSPPSSPQREYYRHISQTTASWWFSEQAWWYSTSISSWTALWPFSSPFQPCL